MKKTANQIVSFICLIILSSVSIASEDEWSKRYSEIGTEVCNNVIGECHVYYSAYESDEHDLPVNNLHQIAVKGDVIVIQEHDSHWGEGESYQSQLVCDPTWLELSIIANEQVIKTGDYHHKYIEGFNVIYIKNGIQYINLYLGS